jgi:hypothetical protein
MAGKRFSQGASVCINTAWERSVDEVCQFLSRQRQDRLLVRGRSGPRAISRCSSMSPTGSCSTSITSAARTFFGSAPRCRMVTLTSTTAGAPTRSPTLAASRRRS